MTGRRHYNPRPTNRLGKRPITVGYSFVRIAIDDCTRLAYAEVLPDETAISAIAFLRRPVTFHKRHGIAVERLLTDKGPAYRSAIHAIAYRTLGIRHLRILPRRSQTNGKAERFIRPMLAGSAYARSTAQNENAQQLLTADLWTHNHRCRYSARRQPPISRLKNLLGTCS